MCGIFGAISDSQVNPELVKQLGIKSQCRGTDATGLYLCSSKKVMKASVTASDFFEKFTLDEKLAGEKAVIGHTRHATRGDINFANNHPLYSDKGGLVLVHNGTISTARSKYHQYDYKAEVDSEIAVAALVEDGLKGLKDITGSAALVFSVAGKPEIYAWRKTMPLHIAFSEHTIAFASTGEILKSAIEDSGGNLDDWGLLELQEYFLYTINTETMVVSQSKEPIKTPTYHYGSTNTNTQIVSYGGGKKVKLKVTTSASNLALIKDLVKRQSKLDSVTAITHPKEGSPYVVVKCDPDDVEAAMLLISSLGSMSVSRMDEEETKHTGTEGVI